MAAAKRRISIRDVAAEAGVSVTTVSNALSGKGRLNERTRLDVQGVAARLGFSPNATARGLQRGRTGVLGLTISSVGGVRLTLSDFDYFTQLLTAATQAALDLEHALVLCPVAGSTALWDRLPVDGAIIVDPVIDDPVLALLHDRRLPVVTTGRTSNANGQWVDNDHRAATLDLLDHLHAEGARRIALLTAPPVQSYTIDIADAYRGWCATHDHPPQIDVVGGDLSEQGGYDAASRLLAGAEPPDAIYATMDRLALGVVLCAQSRGVAVPDRLMVAAITDSEASRHATPPITAVQLNPRQIGERAVRMLVDAIEGEAPPGEGDLVPTRLIKRASTLRRRGL